MNMFEVNNKNARTTSKVKNKETSSTKEISRNKQLYYFIADLVQTSYQEGSRLFHCRQSKVMQLLGNNSCFSAQKRRCNFSW